MFGFLDVGLIVIFKRLVILVVSCVKVWIIVFIFFGVLL